MVSGLNGTHDMTWQKTSIEPSDVAFCQTTSVLVFVTWLWNHQQFTVSCHTCRVIDVSVRGSMCHVVVLLIVFQFTNVYSSVDVVQLLVGPYWDVYLTTLLCVVVGFLLLLRRRQWHSAVSRPCRWCRRLSFITRWWKASSLLCAVCESFDV